MIAHVSQEILQIQHLNYYDTNQYCVCLVDLKYKTRKWLYKDFLLVYAGISELAAFNKEDGTGHFLTSTTSKCYE